MLRYSEQGERYKDKRSSSHISGFITSYCCRYVDSLWESSKRPQSQIEAKGYLSKRETKYVYLIIVNNINKLTWKIDENALILHDDHDHDNHDNHADDNNEW